MDIRKIKKLIELLEESGIAEIEIKEGEEAVRISRMSVNPPPPAYPQYAHLATAPMALAPPIEAAKAPAPAAESAAAKPKPNEHVITAPMVGTFYASPSPGAKAFIEVHLSNVHAREPFRKHSYFSDIAVGVIAGLGAFGYEMAVRAAARYLAARP